MNGSNPFLFDGTIKMQFTTSIYPRAKLCSSYEELGSQMTNDSETRGLWSDLEFWKAKYVLETSYNGGHVTDREMEVISRAINCSESKMLEAAIFYRPDLFTYSYKSLRDGDPISIILYNGFLSGGFGEPLNLFKILLKHVSFHIAYSTSFHHIVSLQMNPAWLRCFIDHILSNMDMVSEKLDTPDLKYLLCALLMKMKSVLGRDTNLANPLVDNYEDPEVVSSSSLSENDWFRLFCRDNSANYEYYRGMITTRGADENAVHFGCTKGIVVSMENDGETKLFGINPLHYPIINLYWKYIRFLCVECYAFPSAPFVLISYLKENTYIVPRILNNLTVCFGFNKLPKYYMSHIFVHLIGLEKNTFGKDIMNSIMGKVLSLASHDWGVILSHCSASSIRWLNRNLALNTLIGDEDAQRIHEKLDKPQARVFARIFKIRAPRKFVLPDSDPRAVHVRTLLNHKASPEERRIAAEHVKEHRMNVVLVNAEGMRKTLYLNNYVLSKIESIINSIISDTLSCEDNMTGTIEDPSYENIIAEYSKDLILNPLVHIEIYSIM